MRTDMKRCVCAHVRMYTCIRVCVCMLWFVCFCQLYMFILTVRLYYLNFLLTLYFLCPCSVCRGPHQRGKSWQKKTENRKGGGGGVAVDSALPLSSPFSASPLPSSSSSLSPPLHPQQTAPFFFPVQRNAARATILELRWHKMEAGRPVCAGNTPKTHGAHRHDSPSYPPSSPSAPTPVLSSPPGDGLHFNSLRFVH